MRMTLIACVSVVLVIAGGLVALLGPRHCPVNREAFERIESGMTQGEVHAILGLPPGDYRTRPHGPPEVIVVLDGVGARSMGYGLMPIGAVEGWEGGPGHRRGAFPPQQQ
jgi:hypothetical protein